jgi:flagellar basal body-associated protein FliL
MAENDENQEPSPDAAAEAEAQPAMEETGTFDSTPRPRSNIFGQIRIPPIVVRVAIGVLVVGAMTTGLFLLVTDVIVPSLGAKPAATAEAEAEKEEEAQTLPGEQFTVDEIIINPAGTHGRRFLRLGVALEAAEGEGGAEVMTELETRKAQIRDLFIREFSLRTLEELTDATVREELRLACIQKINDIMVKGKILNLYFTDYVLQ